MQTASVGRHTVVMSLLWLASPGPAPSALATGFDAHRLWTVNGDQTGAGFGSAVASGDVNGDGFRDVMVGAPSYNGVAGPLNGKVFVYYGSAAGLPSSPSWTAEGEPPAVPGNPRFIPYFGSALASTDVNRDGFDDLVIGAYGYDVLEDGGLLTGAGRIYVYYGSAQGLPPTPSFVADGWGYDLGLITGLGYTLATGDFNGDGYPDVVASNYAKYFGGAAVYYGSASGLSTDRFWQVRGGHGFVGASVSAGDFNGDGYDDLIVTSRPEELEPWEARVFFGSPTGLSTEPGDSPIAVPPFLTFADWLTAKSIGDVDGDGYDDILVLELRYQQIFTYFPAYVLYLGSPTGPHRGHVAGAAVAEPYVGIYGALYPIGDLNGDGFADAIGVDEAAFYLYLGSASGFHPFSDGIGPLPAGPFAAARPRGGPAFDDLIAGDSSNERASLYRGGTDWSFEVTADVSVRHTAAAEGFFELTVANQGPDTVRVRLFDPVPPTLAAAWWVCLYPFAKAAAPGCESEPFPAGDIDSLVTMAPGGLLTYWLFGAVISEPVVNVASLRLPVFASDPDLSNNQTTVVVGPPLHLLFIDDFESGDLSAWSSQSASGVEVVPAAALQGDYGLQVRAPVAGSALVRDDSPNDESDYHAHFLFDPRRFGLDRRLHVAPGRDRSAILFRAHGLGEGPSLFEVLLERKAGSLSLRGRASLDDGTLRETASVPLTDARHLLEVAWRRATSPNANDGQLQLRLDGAEVAGLPALDDEARGGVDYVKLGLASVGRPIPPSIRRTVFIDGFESWRPQ